MLKTNLVNMFLNFNLEIFLNLFFNNFDLEILFYLIFNNFNLEILFYFIFNNFNLEILFNLIFNNFNLEKSFLLKKKTNLAVRRPGTVVSKVGVRYRVGIETVRVPVPDRGVAAQLAAFLPLRAGYGARHEEQQHGDDLGYFYIFFINIENIAG